MNKEQRLFQPFKLSFQFDTMYHYSLEPYKGMNTRYTCPQCGHRKCFVRYTDTATGHQLADRVGRCSREVNCGYHFTPRQFFKEAGVPTSTTYTFTLPPLREPSFIARSTYAQSFCAYDRNNFVHFLFDRFGTTIAEQLVKKYRIGTSLHWPGATVFWQEDLKGRIRTGKIMLYDAATGKRVKEPYNHISWAHSVLQLKDFELVQCLFGEHLLHKPCQNVAIVESEKTAIIASVYLPQFTWLACGSLSNLTVAKCKVLAGHKVTLFPDLKCYDKWKARMREFAFITTFNISHLLEIKATDEDKAKGLDLADYLLRWDIAEFTAAMLD